MNATISSKDIKNKFNKLIKEKAKELAIESEEKDMVIIKHKPSGFKFKLPKKILNESGLNKSAQLKFLAGLGLGTLGAAIPSLIWYSAQQPSDPDAYYVGTDKKIKNYDVWKANIALNKALNRIKNEDFDIDPENDLGRVTIPYSKLNKDLLKYLNFKPSIVAVPERGQSSLLTYRQIGTNAHLHQHPEYWMLHRDKWPAMQMLPEELKRDLNTDVFEFFNRSNKHAKIEGLKGWITWVKNMLLGNLTYDEIIKAKTQPDKYPDLVKRYNEMQKRRSEKLLNSQTLETKKSEYPNKHSKIISLQVKNAKVYAVLAESDSEHANGLSNIKKLEDGTGMLFTKASGCFWMKNVHIPLDLIYMTKKGEIVDIHHMPVEPDPENPKKLYISKDPNKTALALEVPGGWCTKNAISIGDKVEVIKK